MNWIIGLILLLLPTLCFGQDLARLSVGVVGSGAAAAASCTPVDVNTNIDLELCSGTETIKTCRTDHYTSFTVTDVSDILTASVTGEKATISCPNTGGGGIADPATIGMKITPSTTAVGYLTIDHANVNNISYGFWVKIPDMDNTGATVDLLYQYETTGSGIVFYVMLRDNYGVGTMMRLYGTTGTNSTQYFTKNQWYWITVQINKNSTSYAAAYLNGTGAAAVTVSEAATNDGFGLVKWGLCGNADSMANAFYMDDLWIDTTNATYPLGP